MGRTSFFLALALTGCAAGRYHVSREVSGPAAIERPLDGGVVVPFGARESGVLSKGVWIEGRPGAPVAAAAGGKVAFADNRLEGYGQTVILEHPGGIWTVYGRLGEIRVRPGESVRRGQAVGRVGAQARLYFEFRRGDRAEDPARSWSSD